ncbi:MAG: cytochrome c3 family protein [Pirellulales bacterium]|nr:cytochrome c3 family protein [Pirellulales bacterium]
MEWIDRVRPVAGAVLALTPIYLITLVYWGGAPRTTDVGYSPLQPIPFSHALHAGKIRLDCRYCHTTVENAAFAAVPHTSICMNCHATITPDSTQLEPLRQSASTGDPIRWVRVHDLPDYTYFNHSAHVARGVGCVACHGRIDRMEQVYQELPISMGWCLDCHRNPTPHLRPSELVTDMDWIPDEDPHALGIRLMQTHGILPSTDCSTCHR